jgi:hypothetical protein
MRCTAEDERAAQRVQAMCRRQEAPVASVATTTAGGAADATRYDD